MRPFEGIALPTKSLLHIVQCKSLIDPLRISVELVRQIYEDNLNNQALTFCIVCETVRDKNDVVTIVDSIGLSDQITVITIGNNANTRKKQDLNKYSMVVMADHDYECNDMESIKTLKRIEYDGPIVIIYRFRNKFTEKHKRQLLNMTKKSDLAFYSNRLDLPDLIRESRVEFMSKISRITSDDVECMDEYDDPDNDKMAQFMNSVTDFLNDNHFEYLKGIVLCENDETADFMTEAFEAYRMSDIYHPKLLGCSAYSKKEFSRFADLNNRFARAVFINGDTTKSELQSGILFITIDELIDLIVTPIQLRYINMVFAMTVDGITDDMTHIISQTISANNVKDLVIGSKVFAFFDVYRKNLGAQISQIYETFYHQNQKTEEKEIRELINSGDDNYKKEVAAHRKLLKLNAYTELDSLLEERVIDTDVVLTDKKREKLESIYSIRRKDQDYINRRNIVYMNMVNRAKQSKSPMSTTGMLVTESPYLYLPSPKTGKMKGFLKNSAYIQNVEDRTEELKNEVNQIVNAKSDRTRLKEYSGPVWLGRDSGDEQEGSSVVFADETQDTIEFARILGTFKFTRTYKRDGWTEKENRNKKILFLSPVYDRKKLSLFKRQIQRPEYQRFTRMEKIYL